MCAAQANNVRRRSLGRTKNDPWTWLDVSSCDLTEASEVSLLSCYFPFAEGQCVNKTTATVTAASMYSRSTPKCADLKQRFNSTTSDIRQAGIEYLFSHVSEKIIKEAERQFKLVFGEKSPPSNLITVHVRWGDKITSREMNFVPIEKYINAVNELAQQRNNKNQKISVYLATEDPKAVQQFTQKAPTDWTIYVDQYYHEVKQHRQQSDKELYNQNAITAKHTKGQAGLLTLASLLVSLEANDFVLTTASNWSRLMNELRISILDKECNQCTRMIDLQPPKKGLQI
jgi:hypothetical protein